MPHSPIFYENLPVNARLMDERGVLRHVCNAVQPTYDEILSSLAQLEFLVDPDYTPVEFLDWFQQFVALAPIGDRILGLGLDPGWAPLHKREVIKRAWRYWQTKGTERGVREALALWFRWEEAQTEPAVLIRLPWGTRPSATPPQWWGYTTRYDAWPTQAWDERQLLGSGDYPQRYTPDWTIVQSDQTPWEYDDRFDQDFVERDVVAIDSPGSMLGPHAVWEHLTPGVDRWNEVFPGIHPLNEESWDIQARIGVFGWIDGGETEPMVVRRSPATVQTQTVYDVEIIGFRYSDMLPFSEIEVETASQAISPDAVVVRNTVNIGTMEQTLAADFTAVLFSAASEPITASQSISPDAVVVGFSAASEPITARQSISPDAVVVESSAASEPITARQSISPDAVVVESSAASEPITASQAISPDAVVVSFATTPTYRDDTSLWLAAVSGSYSTAELQALDALLGGLATDLLLSKMDRIWHAGFGDTSSDSLVDFVGRNVATLVNAPAFARRQGFTGNGTNSYINTNYVPSAGANWGLNSATGLAFVRSHVYVGSGRVFGGNGASNANQTALGYLSASQSYFCRLNNSSTSSSTSPVALMTTGWGGVTRTESTRVNLLRGSDYIVGLVAAAVESTTETNVPIFVGANNNNNNATVINFISSQITSFNFGGGFTPADYANWQARFDTFHAAIAFS